MGHLHDWIELAANFLEVLAVALTIGFITLGTVRLLFFSPEGIDKGYESYRLGVCRVLLVGLELLVAADVIRTVTLDLTLINVAILGAVIVVRTFLGWTLTLEVEGHWPWQQAKESGPSVTEGNDTTMPQGVAAFVRTTGAGTEREH